MTHTTTSPTKVLVFIMTSSSGDELYAACRSHSTQNAGRPRARGSRLSSPKVACLGTQTCQIRFTAKKQALPPAPPCGAGIVEAAVLAGLAASNLPWLRGAPSSGHADRLGRHHQPHRQRTRPQPRAARTFEAYVAAGCDPAVAALRAVAEMGEGIVEIIAEVKSKN